MSEQRQQPKEFKVSEQKTLTGGGEEEDEDEHNRIMNTGDFQQMHSQNQPNKPAHEQVRLEIQKGSITLDLQNFKLQDLSFLGGQVWPTLIEINLHKNFLTSIDVLNTFRNLRVINARGNYIQEVNLNMQKLTELDLSNNHIEQFPIVYGLPRLQRLILNSNQLEKIRVEFKPPSSLSIEHLDMGNNLLQFAIPSEFNDFLNKLQKLKNLKSLIISDNPFKDEKKNEQIASQLTQLEWFNEERAEIFRLQAFDEEKKQDQNRKKDNRAKTTQGKKIEKGGEEFPTLDGLVRQLESANSHPSYALGYLKELAMQVDKIQNNLSMVDEFFARGQNEQTILETMDTFIQNAEILMEGHYELQQIMLTILSKLTIIKFYDFGVRCFNTLKELIISGKEMEDDVFSVLKKEAFPKLQQQNLLQISPSLLKGLYELIKETNKPDVLKDLYENLFPSWLRSVLDSVRLCKKNAQKFESNEHFDSIIALMSVSVKEYRTNVKKIIDKELLPVIAEIATGITWECGAYINHLRLIEYISYQSDEAASFFISMKNNDLRDENAKDNNETVKLKYFTIAAEIDCLGALLEAEEVKRAIIINNPMIDELLRITSHHRTDPVLLTSICKFAKQFFSREEVKSNQQLVEEKVEKMQNLVQLTPYLGLKKYNDLLIMSKKYYDEGVFAEKSQATQLQHLEDGIVHDLFIAIINLINLFCQEGETPDSQPIFQVVSQSLNDHGREDALFNCLQIPNDEVKLAVVKCLNNVPLSEFDNEEIATVLKLVGSYKNIGAGQTELVLSQILWIMAKLTKEQEAKSGSDFRLKYGERAIAEALDILTRNLSRNLNEEDEEDEKLALSMSCVHFLKFASASPDMKRLMLNRYDPIKTALYNEENCTSSAFMKFPIEIEQTWLGRQFEVLMNTLTGKDSLEPYTFVSFRVIQRMADILQNKLDVDTYDPFQAGIDVIGSFKSHYKENLKQRIQSESQYWVDPPDDLLHNLKKDVDNFDTYFIQHHFFTNEGIKDVKDFLTKKNASLSMYLKKEFVNAREQYAPKLNKILELFKKKCEDKEQLQQKEQEAKKGQAIIKEDNEEEEKEEGFNLLRSVLQLEDIGLGYDASKSSDQFVKHAQSKGKNSENINKRDHKTGVQNMKMRSLCVAAYLRCVFASIEYAPNLKLQTDAIRVVKEIDFFKNLTLLCDSTGWLEANIGAKYLRIMRNVIKVPYEDSEEPKEHLYHYEIIAVVIKKILNQVLIKIKNEQQVALNNEDKIMINELTLICSLMCKQIQLFKWSDMEVKQQGQHTRTRRTPQEKVIDKQISFIFPSFAIQTFIAIIFRDMHHAFKVFDPENKPNTEEIESEYIQNKNNLSRENIKLFLGEYLSKCKDNKYEVLESIMKFVVFEKKELRDSFLQAILKALQDSSYQSAFEQFIFEHKFSLATEERERIIRMSWVELSIDQVSTYQTKLITFTNKGMHIFKAPKSSPCSVCPAENLCPDGPRPEMIFAYDQLAQVTTFPNLPQKIVISIQLGGQKKSSKQKQLEIHIVVPSVIQAQYIVNLLNEILSNDKFRHDQLATKAIEHLIGTDQEVRIQRYVSLNSSKGLFSFGGSSTNAIKNFSLLIITNTSMIILKEYQHKWYREEDEELKVEEVVEKDNQDDESMIIEKKEVDPRLKIAIQGMFSIIIKKNLKDIDYLHLSKGKDPVMDIQFGKHQEKIIFLTDYCRQVCIETLMGIKQGR